jgi:hypothetical protein
VPRWVMFVMGTYAGGALLTLGFQTWLRLDQCFGIASCAVSLAKGVLWSTNWPAFWPVYAAGFENVMWTRFCVVMGMGMLAALVVLVFVVIGSPEQRRQ